MLYIFPKSTIDAGGSRHRAYNLAKFLARAGHESELVIAPIYRTEVTRTTARIYYQKKIFSLRRNDVVFLQNPIFSWYFIFCIGLAKLLFNPTIIFDFDDATWVQKPLAPRVLAFFSDKFVVASHYLATWKPLRNKPILIMPNLVDYEISEKYGAPKKPSGESREVVMGWMGGAPASMQNLKLLTPVFKRLAAKNLSCSFTLVGALGSQEVRDAFSDTGIKTKFVDSLAWGTEGEIQKINLTFDIGLCPLEHSVSNEARCSLKVLDYMAAGIPVVISPIGENKYFIREGSEGFLPTSEDEWVDALERLITDTALRVKMGHAAYERVKQEYSYQANVEKYISFFERKPLKVLYLLNREQKKTIAAIRRQELPDNHLYGMLRLAEYGIEADYVEIEQIVPENIARFLREFFNVYWIHIFFFFSFLKYDIVFTSTAFGSQLVHTLYPGKKPQWVMLDFNITGFLGNGTTLKQKLFHFLVQRADGIVTLDVPEAETLKKQFPHRAEYIECIPFSVDMKFFTPRVSEQERISIFSPGRDPGRDFKTLFKAVEDLHIPVRITARPWNIKKLLPLPHFVTHEDLSFQHLLAAYAESTIVVIPLDTRSNVNNSMGISTIVESMAMGKAIIATKTPTTESYIQDGVNGILVEAQDVEALSSAIQELVENPKKRMMLGENARHHAEKYYAATTFAAQLARYFKRLV